MATLGADPDQLDLLAQKFDEEAQKIEATITLITTQLGNTWWEGTDALRFRDQWASTHTPQLKQVITVLNGAAGDCRKQASQQRETSAA